MNKETTVDTLESALFERAKKLADEYMARARQTRERMIEEANERLRIREEREMLAAEAEAERLFRRRVQAMELQLQAELDRHRWELMGAVKDDMRQRFTAHSRSEQYLATLARLLAEGVTTLGEGEELVAQLNAGDLERLAPKWDEFVREAAGRAITLESTPGDFLGGVLVRTADDSVRMDNTFEGRLDRLEDSINQVIAEALYPAGMTMEG